MSTKRIWISTHGNGAQNWYRAYAPYLFCQKELLREGIELVFGKELDLREDWHALYLHQLILPAFHEIIMKMQQNGVKIALGLDDNNYLIPSWNPAYANWGRREKDLLDWSINQVDLVVASTDPLRDYLSYRCLPSKIHVCPNLLDWTAWPAAWVEKDSAEAVRILWAGSIHHQKDFDIIVKPLRTLMKKYNVQCVFMGALPDQFWALNAKAQLIINKKISAKVSYIAPVELEKYPTALHALHADIGICPLTVDRFNEAKSNIKALEYTMAGACVVAADSLPYRNVSGIRLCSSAREWYHTLESLVHDVHIRDHYRRYAHSTVLQDWCWQGWKRHAWLAMFRRLVS